MDNITHTLIGAAMGQGVNRFMTRVRYQKVPGTIWWAAILGNNFPDIDVVMRPGFGTLGYLFEHRGYTHTVTFAPVEGVIVAVLAALITRVHRTLDRSQWLMLIGVSTAAVLLHIAADYCNDYGVHPFSPFNSHWYYGGFLFILEPLIWAALLPLWIRTRAGQVAALGFLALLWFAPQLTWPASLGGTVFFLAMAGWQKLRPGLLQPVAGVAITMALFITGEIRVRAQVQEQLARERPEETLVHIVTTPSPGNPFCWRVIPITQMDRSSGLTSGQPMTPFFERVGVLSIFPKVFSPATCFALIQELPPFIAGRVSLQSSESVDWKAEFRSTREALAELAKTYCRFSQYLRFARAPFWSREGQSLIVSDLRYAGRAGASFARFKFEPEDRCPANEAGAPSWERPSGLL